MNEIMQPLINIILNDCLSNELNLCYIKNLTIDEKNALEPLDFELSMTTLVIVPLGVPFDMIIFPFSMDSFLISSI